MARRISSRFLDCSGGLKSGLSDYGRRARHFTLAQNVEFRPYGAAKVRPGTQRACSATLTKAPHSLMEWVNSSGASQKYVSCADTAGILYRMSGTAFTAQTTPHALGAALPLSWDQLNGTLWATEIGGGSELMSFGPSNTAETWLSGNLPVPGNTLTLAKTTGGFMVSSVTYWYRLRWWHRDGSSASSTPQSVAMGAADTKVNISTIPLGSRADYLGWVLERTDALGTVNGPFFFLAQGTATTFADTFADSDLGYQATEITHGTLPGGHVDGIIAMNDRLLAWEGSTVYLSQPIIGDQYTGIANWDARNAYDFGPDDGDKITAVCKQSDRYVIFKQHSVWALEGNDPSNYRVLSLFSGAGCSGPRAAAFMGGTGWFYGAAGLHRMSGNSIAPFGYVEVGDVLATFSKARIADVVIKNHLGQRVLIAFSTDGAKNNDMLVYDQRFGTWAEWTNIYARDILVQKIPDFGDSEAFVFADPRDRGVSGLHNYLPWIGFYGVGDEKQVDGAGAGPVALKLRTPWIDDGSPDTFKSWERVELYGQGSHLTLNVSIELDPGGDVVQRTMQFPVTGSLWGDGRNWGDGTLWGSATSDSSGFSGLDEGAFGRRYRATFSASVYADGTFKGYVLDGIIQPERRYS